MSKKQPAPPPHHRDGGFFVFLGMDEKPPRIKPAYSTAAPRVFSRRRHPSPVSDGHAAALIRRAARMVRTSQQTRTPPRRKAHSPAVLRHGNRQKNGAPGKLFHLPTPKSSPEIQTRNPTPATIAPNFRHQILISASRSADTRQPLPHRAFVYITDERAVYIHFPAPRFTAFKKPLRQHCQTPKNVQKSLM